MPYDSKLMERRNAAICKRFNEIYANLEHGSTYARLNIAKAQVADEFYLKPSSIDRILKVEKKSAG